MMNNQRVKSAQEYSKIIPDEILCEVGRWIEAEKHGKITINFFAGSTPNMNCEESKKIMCTKKHAA